MNTSLAISYVSRWINQVHHFPMFIAVAGGTCAGKSTFCRSIAASIPYRSQIIALDDYFKDIDDPTLPKGEGYRIFDEPGSYHSDEFQAAVKILLSEANVQAPVYDLSVNKRSEKTHQLNTAPVIIADGLFAIDLLKEIHSHQHPGLFIYIENDPGVNLSRRINRDSRLYNIPPHIVRQFYFEIIEPRQKKFIEPQKNYAGIVVNTS